MRPSLVPRVYSVHQRPLSCTEYHLRTPEACFLHRVPLKMRRVPQEAVLRTARIFRTVEACFWYRVLSYRITAPGAHVEACSPLPPISGTESSRRGKLLPLRNSEIHKKEADLLVDLSGDACRIQTYDLLIRSQMLYSAELRRQSHTGEPVLYYYSTSFTRPRLASLMRAFLPARARM